MILHGAPPRLECSSKGDRRFSAYFARIRARGNQSIEQLYQGAKLFDDGSTDLPTKLAKQRSKTHKVVNLPEVHAFYSLLWDEYILENPHLARVLIEASGVSDIFGQPGHACQATELWRIRTALLAHAPELEPVT